MLELVLQRLAAVSINLVPMDLDHYFVFERDGFIALVERRRDNSLGRVGTAGLLTEGGLAPLVWRGDTPAFRTKAGDQPADALQVDALRRFQADLDGAVQTSGVSSPSHDS